MDSNLQFISTKKMSKEDWLSYRYSGIGASEVGAILGLNQYKSSIQLYYEKIGAYDMFTVENLACFMGIYQEPHVAELWQYWDGDVQSMMNNYRLGKIVRRCQQVNFYIRNPKFPHLFVSLDRKINKHGAKGEGALEVKTISGYESNKWIGDLPPAYVMQVQTQLGVCGFSYGEMAVLTDGRQFQAYPFEFMPDVFNTIVKETSEFWERVKKGKVLVNKKFEAERNFNNRLRDEFRAEIESLEPPPDGSEAYADFLKNRHSTATGYRPGTEEEFLLAIESNKVKEEIERLEEEQRYLTNSLKKSMGDIQTIEFSKNRGKVDYKFNKNDVRVFNNRVKIIS